MAKTTVNGDSANPLYKYLKANTPAGLLGSSIKWNFSKFLVGADGKPIKRYAPTTSPLELVPDIEALLEK